MNSKKLNYDRILSSMLQEDVDKYTNKSNKLNLKEVSLIRLSNKVIDSFRKDKAVVTDFTTIRKLVSDDTELMEAGWHFTFNRAWTLIKDVKDFEHIQQNKTQLKFGTLDNFTQMLKHYEEMEHYDKCAHIKKIIDCINL